MRWLSNLGDRMLYWLFIGFAVWNLGSWITYDIEQTTRGAFLQSGSWVIVVGDGAGSEKPHHCSVVLGNGLRLPDGPVGDHVLMTPDGTRSLAWIGPATEAEINAALLWARGIPLKIDPAYIERWNGACAMRDL